MKLPRLEIVLLWILACLLCNAAIGAEPAPSKEKLTLGQAERLSVDLKQGMTLQEVERLLGKPKRTALKPSTNYSGPGGSSQGTLQWTYAWTSQTQSDRILQVVFAGKSPEEWLVHSWDWGGY